MESNECKLQGFVRMIGATDIFCSFFIFSMFLSASGSHDPFWDFLICYSHPMTQLGLPWSSRKLCLNVQRHISSPNSPNILREVSSVWHVNGHDWNYHAGPRHQFLLGLQFSSFPVMASSSTVDRSRLGSLRIIPGIGMVGIVLVVALDAVGDVAILLKTRTG